MDAFDISNLKKDFYDVDLLIFDLDGTLLNSHKVNYEAIKKGLADMGWDIPVTEEGIIKIMIETSENFYGKLLPPDKLQRKEDLRTKVRQYYAPMIAEYGTAFPGINETLEKLKKRGYKLALYSFASPGYFQAAIKKLGLKKIFDYTESAQESDLTKGALVKKIKEHFNISNAAVVGDSLYDINAAKENGDTSVGVSYGYGGETIKAADIVIDEFPQMLDIFDRRLPIFEKILSKVLENKNRDKACVIGINGIDTSGKTVFAKAFENFLKAKNYQVQVINLDDFHNPKKIRYSGANQAENYYNKSFDLGTIIDKIMKPLSQTGRCSVDLELLDLHTDGYDLKRSFKISKDTIVIFEGVFIFRQELAPYIDYKVFIDIPLQESKARAAVRDVPIYGSEVLKKYDEKYLPAQERYLKEYSPEKSADMVIDNTDWEYPKIKNLA